MAEKARLSKKPFYGYIIVAACALIMVTVYGVINNCYAFYLGPVTQELGLSRQSYSLSQSVIFIALMCTAPFAGAVYRRHGVMQMMRLSMAALIIAYALYGLCSKLWQFYALSAVIGVAQCFVTTIPISILIRNWFERSYGLMLGIAFMGSGIGGMIFSPVIRGLIEGAGWRWTFLTVAGIMGIVNFVTVFIMLRAKPSDMGLLPLGHTQSVTGGPEPEPELTGGTLASSLKLPSFYIMMLFAVVYSTASYGLCTYIAPYYTELAHPAAAITLCSSAAMGGMAVGKIVFGRLLDRAGLKPGTLIAMGAMMAGFVGMLLSKNIAMFALVLFGVALGCPFGTVAPAIVVREMYGTRDFGAKLGCYSAAASLGTAISPFFGGAMYDAMGGYREAMLILLALSIALFIGYSIVIPGKNRKSKAATL